MVRRMNQTLLWVLTGLLLFSACKTAGPKKKDPRIDVSYAEFDQSDAHGWRSMVAQRRFDDAANLIQDYLKGQPALSRDQKALLRFRRGELLAIQGKNKAAIADLRQAYATAGSALSPSWNLYIDGIISYLDRDRAKLETIAAQLERSGQRDHSAAVKALLLKFDESYESIVFPK